VHNNEVQYKQKIRQCINFSEQQSNLAGISSQIWPISFLSSNAYRFQPSVLNEGDVKSYARVNVVFMSAVRFFCRRLAPGLMFLSVFIRFCA